MTQNSKDKQLVQCLKKECKLYLVKQGCGHSKDHSNELCSIMSKLEDCPACIPVSKPKELSDRQVGLDILGRHKPKQEEEQKCPECSGNGIAKGLGLHPGICSTCKGTGLKPKPSQTDAEMYRTCAKEAVRKLYNLIEYQNEVIANLRQALHIKSKLTAIILEKVEKKLIGEIKSNFRLSDYAREELELSIPSFFVNLKQEMRK